MYVVNSYVAILFIKVQPLFSSGQRNFILNTVWVNTLLDPHMVPPQGVCLLSPTLRAPMPSHPTNTTCHPFFGLFSLPTESGLCPLQTLPTSNLQQNPRLRHTLLRRYFHPTFHFNESFPCGLPGRGPTAPKHFTIPFAAPVTIFPQSHLSEKRPCSGYVFLDPFPISRSPFSCSSHDQGSGRLWTMTELK